MAEYSPNFPQYLSQKAQILWWELDQVVIAALSFLFAILYGGITPWIAFIVIQILYSLARKNKPRGFLQHLIYMFGFTKFNNYPEYFNQNFHE